MSNQIVMERKLDNGLRLQLVQGDITQEQVDAIVNAANEQLQHAGGVAAAIAKAGGPVIQKQSNAWVEEHGTLSHNQATVTDAGDLPCRWVIHVVGPRWGEGQEADKLSSAVQAALEAAHQEKCASMAMPAISTGIFGYPVDQAAEVILSTIQSFARSNGDSTLSKVHITILDDETLKPFREALEALDTADE
ncbi:MAG: macro domain-containing protein [Anaerolineales bacterium]